METLCSRISSTVISLFVARYTGLVPIRCMLKQLYAQRQTDTILLIAVAPAEDEFLFHQELLTLAVHIPSFVISRSWLRKESDQGVDLVRPNAQAVD